MQCHVSLDIHQALVQAIDLRYPGRERLQLQAFDREQFLWDRMDMLFVRAVDPVAPCPRLSVQVVPVGKGPPGEKVPLDKMEGTFHTAGAIRVADLMGDEPESQALGEGGHFGHGNHLAARAAQHYDMSVVDHDALRRAAEVTMRLGKEHLAVEALEPRENLKKQHARVAQDRRGGLHIAPFAAEHNLVGRRVVLNLLARSEAILTRRLFFDLTDTVTAAESRQRLVGQFGSLRNQFLMDPDQVSVAGGIQFQDPLPVRLRALWTQDGRDVR